MCKLLERVPQAVSEDKETGKLKDGILGSMEEDDKSKIVTFDEGKRVDEKLKWLGMSKEDFFEAKRCIVCVNAFRCEFEKKQGAKILEYFQRWL